MSLSLSPVLTLATEKGHGPCPVSSPHCVSPLFCPGSFFRMVAAPSGHTEADPRNTGELTPIGQPSANGRWESVANAPKRGHSEVYLPQFLRGSPARYFLVVHHGNQLNRTPPLSTFLPFSAHLLYSPFLLLEQNCHINYLHPSSCLRFCLGEIHVNIIAVLTILTFVRHTLFLLHFPHLWMIPFLP